MSANVQARVFLVGCARSGTTLLQAMLATHSSISSFPETQYFARLLGQIHERKYGAESSGISSFKRILNRSRIGLGIAFPRGDRARSAVSNLLQNIEQPQLDSLYPAYPISIRAHAQGYQRVLDEITRQEESAIWVDKSPNHLYYLSEINRYIESPRFIHIVRSGLDVVASIYDAALKYPLGNDFKLDIDDCIQRWNSAVAVSQALQYDSGHLIIQYERLVDDPVVELKRVTDFLEIDYEESMASEYSEAVGSLSGKGEQWKTSVKDPIKSHRGHKFQSLFDEATQQYIRKNLVTPNLDSQTPRAD